MNTSPEPILRCGPEGGGFRVLHPSGRTVTHRGRKGLNFTSIHGRAMLYPHPAGIERGTATLWVLPLQDLAPATQFPTHRKSNPFFDRFVFLSDRESVQEIEAANFVFFFQSFWYPVLIAKFGYSDIHRAAFGRDRTAMASAGHFQMHALQWYQLALTWDRSAGVFVLYANGVKVGHSDTYAQSPLPSDPPAPALYFGSPAYAMGQISFYDRILNEADLRQIFESEAGPARDPALQEELERTYHSRDLPAFQWSPDTAKGWSQELALSLADKADYIRFFQQGHGPGVGFTEEGMRITTPDFEEYWTRMGKTLTGDQLDMTRIYLWTRRIFEGDLFVSVEFKLHRHGGLALLLAQAAGMQGEDFLNDYPLRSDGSMMVVHREDVRNYHWEFYREINDTRNDLVSHAVIKNPWLRPMAFQIEDRRWELDRWYRLTFRQVGAELTGSIDGTVVFSVIDHGFENSGPVLRHGRVALRAMMRTDLTFRRLEVWTRPDLRWEETE